MTRWILTSAMCVAVMVVTTDAFVPTFVAPRHALPAVYKAGGNLPVSSRPASKTALQMNLFDRFSRVAKSNLNNILKNLEDPEKIMTQALEDMQVRRAVEQSCEGCCRIPKELCSEAYLRLIVLCGRMIWSKFVSRMPK